MNTPPLRKFLTSRQRNIFENAREIYCEWDRRRRIKEKVPPYETAHSYLKRAVYDFIRHPSVTKKVLKTVVRQERGKVPRTSLSKNNPFFLGLLIVFKDDDEFTRGDRSKFATELMYAHMHDVPAKYLIGFIYQVGGYAQISQKIKTEEKEEWMKEFKKVSIESGVDSVEPSKST